MKISTLKKIRVRLSYKAISKYYTTNFMPYNSSSTYIQAFAKYAQLLGNLAPPPWAKPLLCLWFSFLKNMRHRAPRYLLASGPAQP